MLFFFVVFFFFSGGIMPEMRNNTNKTMHTHTSHSMLFISNQINVSAEKLGNYIASLDFSEK